MIYLTGVHVGPLDIATADLTAIQRHAPGAVLPANAHWTRKLEAAQNVIFCKEVFAQVKSQNFSLICESYWHNRL